MITEAQFSGQVEGLLKMFGWLWCHFRPAQTGKGWRTALSGDKGLPDIIAVRPPRLLFAELKTEKGKVTPHQEKWLDALRQCWGVECFLWRPGDIERIMEILR